MLHPDFDGFFYHATSVDKAGIIEREGLAAGSFLCVGDIAEYYLETIRDEGARAVLLKIDASDLSLFSLGPDMPGIEEPICGVIGLREENIWEAWDKTEGTWQDCLSLIGSLQSLAPIPAHLISRDA